MAFGLDVFGLIMTMNNAPEKRGFNKIVFNGEMTLDEIHIRNKVLTDAEVLALNAAEDWQVDTAMLAHFENTLQAGNYTSLTKSIVNFMLMKKETADAQYTLVKNIPNIGGVNSAVDYLAKNNTTYEYAVFPVDEDGIIGDSFTASAIHNFFGWVLVDADNTFAYKFDLEINTDAIQFVQDVKIYDNFTELPAVGIGKRNYRKFSIETMPYSINGEEFVIDLALLKQVKAFINNGKEKYLKNTAGELFKVATLNFSYKYMDRIASQPYSISFDVIQIGTEE